MLVDMGIFRKEIIEFKAYNNRSKNSYGDTNKNKEIK